MRRPTVGMALVGVGGWGRNLARTLVGMPEVDLRWVCDSAPDALAHARTLCPRARATSRLDDLLADPRVTAVAVATPAATHHAVGLQVLAGGRDLFLEKPMALEVPHAQALHEMARSRGCLLMVGHLLYYHPALQRLHALIAAGELGPVRTLVSQRLNFGTVRSDENALWSLAPHDVSVALYLQGRMPTQVSARGLACLGRPNQDVAFLTLDFGGEALAQIHVSWLDPRKTRCLTVVGTQGMAVFDDLEPVEKLRIHDKRVALKPRTDAGTDGIALHTGGVFAPELPAIEPLRAELEHFVACVRDRSPPLSDGADGLQVLQVLAAAQTSMVEGGRPVRLDPPETPGESPPVPGAEPCP